MALPLKEEKLQNLLVNESFTDLINSKSKRARVECKYCYKELNRNFFRLHINLNDCKPSFAAKQADSTLTLSQFFNVLSQQSITTLVQTSSQKLVKN